MNVTILEADLDELLDMGATPQQAFARGCAALGNRTFGTTLRMEAETEEGLAELVDFFAEKSADAHSVRFGFTTNAASFEETRNRYEELGRESYRLRMERAPELQQRLLSVRAREEMLERRLAERGVDASQIGPVVPPEEALDPLLGGWDAPPLRLSALPPPEPRLFQRLLRRAFGKAPAGP